MSTRAKRKDTNILCTAIECNNKVRIPKRDQRVAVREHVHIPQSHRLWRRQLGTKDLFHISFYKEGAECEHLITKLREYGDIIFSISLISRNV